MVNWINQPRKEANINRERVLFDDTMTRLQAFDVVSVYLEQNPGTELMVWALGAWVIIDAYDILEAMKRGDTTDNIRVVVEGKVIKLIQG